MFSSWPMIKETLIFVATCFGSRSDMNVTIVVTADKSRRNDFYQERWKKLAPSTKNV